MLDKAATGNPTTRADVRRRLYRIGAGSRPRWPGFGGLWALAGWGRWRKTAPFGACVRGVAGCLAVRFVKACGLQSDAAAYFERLVEFNQASGAREREECYAKLSAFARYRNAQKLEPAHAAYFAN